MAPHLSLRTVPLTHRLLAMLLALVTAMLLYLPANALIQGGPLGANSLANLWFAYWVGFLFIVLGFPFFFSATVLMWGLPGLIFLHVILKWLRGNFFITVLAGMLCGILGLLALDVFTSSSHPDALICWMHVRRCGCNSSVVLHVAHTATRRRQSI
jgi:hypothetical protein